jgi:hypothetical protein
MFGQLPPPVPDYESGPKKRRPLAPRRSSPALRVQKSQTPVLDIFTVLSEDFWQLTIVASIYRLCCSRSPKVILCGSVAAARTLDQPLPSLAILPTEHTALFYHHTSSTGPLTCLYKALRCFNTAQQLRLDTNLTLAVDDTDVQQRALHEVLQRARDFAFDMSCMSSQHFSNWYTCCSRSR